MSNEDFTFRSLEPLAGGDRPPSQADSPLGEWYESVRDVPIHQLDDGSLGIAIRQRL